MKIPASTSSASDGANNQPLTISYLLTLYHKFEQAIRLVNRLAAPHTTYVIHVECAVEARLARGFQAAVAYGTGVVYSPRLR